VSRSLQLLLTAVITTAVIVMVGFIVGVPIPSDFGGFAGLSYWTAVTLIASAFPVRMPRGTIVSVAIAPILAVAAVGGPTAAGIVAGLGTTEWREIRGRVPWYGTLYNHAQQVIPAVWAGLVFEQFSGLPFRPSMASLVAVAAAGVVYFTLNAGLSTLTFVVRDHQPPWSILAGDIRLVVGNLLGMVPLAWLIALSFQVAWWSAMLFALPLYMNRRAYQSIVEIREMFTQTLRALTGAIGARDPYTADHSERVQLIAVDVGRVMRCSEAELEALEWGGLLHDIGKIGVRDDVLLKEGRLTREERILMNKHPEMGARIIEPVTRLAPEVPIILHHHEWYNGSGYPDHLAGEAIPKLARILHVADAFEAMTSKRPYRMIPLTVEQALGELRKFAGIQFDPVVLDAFARTHWVAGVSDPGKPPSTLQPVPLLSQVAAMRSQAIEPASGPAGDAR
jgi:putative nucleotidyltransferase with HDIG domain